MGRWLRSHGKINEELTFPSILREPGFQVEVTKEDSGPGPEGAGMWVQGGPVQR